MDFFQVRMKFKSFPVAVILLVFLNISTEAHNTAYVKDNQAYSDVATHIVNLDHLRLKRAASGAPPAAPTEAEPPAPSPPASAANTTSAEAANSTVAAASNATDDSNRTNVSSANATTPATAVVTQVPILGANGTGQRWTNLTESVPKVSDPISSGDDNLTDVFETPEKVKAQHNLANLTYDNHDFYNSTFIGNLTYFNEYWSNISESKADVHTMLSSSHRRATNVRLKFKFPFYGNWIDSITVATGGFIYTGEHSHAWLAATQYIAPLMANFDTSLNNESLVKLSDDGEKFTAFWENVTLRESPHKPFTFAVTLYKNGDIVFAYKHLPMPIEDIDDTAHPVKIGISDAYLTDRVIFYVRRKTIYEYHRVSFKHYEVGNQTILRLTALPTCLQYDSCDACLDHNTGFDCAWCENIRKCSSGTDRNKQDWQLRKCDQALVSNTSACPARGAGAGAGADAAYVSDAMPDPNHEAVVNTLNSTEVKAGSVPENSAFSSPVREPKVEAAHSGMGGVVAALAAVALVCSFAAWTLYAFKNPHTRSGQILIKYRPSQWSWRRGEARYTAATIHM